ncbi:protein of unknown function [Candidatus Methylocalor cossyra]|uniref:Transposase DDE domain-containing protein n=1 Tax=Candidatus Methylocalor cossyra TaxID=3108543 RepID=A0ABM9NKR2_9GAMM
MRAQFLFSELISTKRGLINVDALLFIAYVVSLLGIQLNDELLVNLRTQLRTLWNRLKYSRHFFRIHFYPPGKAILLSHTQSIPNPQLLLSTFPNANRIAFFYLI